MNVHIDECLSKTDKLKLKKTNKLFNDNQFNSSYKIGKLSNIINQREFNSVDEWIDYYFETGKDRKNNYDYGRTKEEFDDIIKEYYEMISSSLPDENFTYEDAEKQMYQRVFYDSWIGFNHEFKMIDELKTAYPDYDFKKTSSLIDLNYAIDIEVFKNNKLIAGLQVKPISYMKNMNLDYIKDSDVINKEKNLKYINENNVPVFYLFYSKNKTIIKNNDYNLLSYTLTNFKNYAKQSMTSYIAGKNRKLKLMSTSCLYQYKYDIIFEVKDDSRVICAYVFKDSYSMYNLAKYQVVNNVPIYELEYIDNMFIFRKVQVIIS